VIHTSRIRCNYCGRRIPATSVVCPNCLRNPRAFYWKRWHVLLLGAVVLVAALSVFFLFPNVSGPIKSFFAQVQPTNIALATGTVPARTPSPISVVIVATRPPASATVPPPTPTRLRPTATSTPTLAATATITPTRAPRTPGVTDTPTPIPTRVPVAPPQLLSPNDNERILGANKHVVLRFQPAQKTGLQEWYRVQVDFLDRSGQPVSWCAFTKLDNFEFPREFFDDSSPSVRSFLWRVNVVRSEQAEPTTCDAPFEILSAPSQVWTFYWY